LTLSNSLQIPEGEKKINQTNNKCREGSCARRAENLVDVLPETRNVAVALLHPPEGSEYLLFWFGVFFQTFHHSSVEFNLQGKKLSLQIPPAG